MDQGDAGLRGQLEKFVRYRREYLRGDEKGEAQIFSEALFRAFGHEGLRQAGATLEQRIKKRDAKGTAFADLMWKPRCLIEMKKTGVDLGRVYRQAFDYWVQAVPDRPRYLVLCNFDESWVYDFDQQLDAPMDRVKIDDLPHRWEALGFLLPEPVTPVFGNDLVAVTRDAVLLVRAQNLAAGMSLAEQYNIFRQPGKSRLRTLHTDLDAAVHSAYGFSTDEERLTQLLALNLDLAAEPQHARGPGPT